MNPGFGAKLTFVVEAVDSVEVRNLVVSSEQEEVVRVLDLVAEHEDDRLEEIRDQKLEIRDQATNLDALRSSVYVVSEEEVVGLGREAGEVEESEKVGELAVDVSCRGQD